MFYFQERQILLEKNSKTHLCALNDEKETNFSTLSIYAENKILHLVFFCFVKMDKWHCF